MLEQHEVVAVERRILECAVPLFSTQTKDGEIALLGTSTLMEVGEQLLLVTAKHLFENLDLRTLAFPGTPLTSDVWTLGGVHRLEPLEEYFDVSILSIESAETAKVLRAGWRPVSLDSVASPSDSAVFVLSGFPGDLTAPTPEYLTGKMLSIYTDRLPSVPQNATAPVYSDVDLFFLCDDSAETLDGKPQKLPRLQGTSGAGIWEIAELGERELWTPDRALRLVAVQSTYRPLQYFRGKSWKVVANVLQKSETPALAEAGRRLTSRL